MEEKKFDLNSLIGFLLLGAIMLWWMNTNKPTPEEVQEQQKTEQTTTISETTSEITNETPVAVVNDSIAQLQAKQRLGAFGFSERLSTSAKSATSTVENDVLKLVVSNKGGQIIEAQLKNYKTYDQLPLYLIKDSNASFILNFNTTDNRTLSTKELYFEPTLEGTTLSMKAKVSNNQYLEYRYELKPNQYMVDFTVRSQGLSNIINTAKPIALNWALKGYRHEHSMRSENMYTYMYYKSDDDVDYLSIDDDEKVDNTTWAAFKQHFFSSILLNKDGFKNVQLTSENLVKDSAVDTVFTKKFSLTTALSPKGGELNENMQWYFGPNDYKILKSYEGQNLDEIIDLGWGIFGFINRTLFIPIFNGLKGFIGNYGIIIILMTFVVRIFMSPLVYKSYLSSAKMKVLKPEMEEINKRLPGKENAMKRQQETMALQSKAGVSPLAGCIPALLQMPVFFALFRFFPSNIDLRQKSFLWANDLSSYDTIWKFPNGFSIPFYGDHISLFPILASVAIFFYMKMSQSQQMNMQQPTQEGMPDMQKMMKYMLYFSPIMMLFFFNQYASSLSLYYFISNLLTLTIMFIIKKYIIDEDKIHAKIQENKKKPKKQSKFKKRLADAMKQAQEQQEAQKRKKK